MRASRYPEAAFLATMTASATHEIRNVLAIIKESAGLIEDLFRLCSEGGVLDQEKVHRAVHRVDVQVKRGADILTHLNRLSHALDSEITTLDLRQELEQAVFLSKRLAGKKRQTLSAVQSMDEASVRVHPLHLQMVLFACIDRCIESFPEGTNLSARIMEEGGLVRVEIRGDPDTPVQTSMADEKAAWEYLQNLAESLGARSTALEDGRGIAIIFQSPGTIQNPSAFQEDREDK